MTGFWLPTEACMALAAAMRCVPSGSSSIQQSKHQTHGAPSEITCECSSQKSEHQLLVFPQELQALTLLCLL